MCVIDPGEELAGFGERRRPKTLEVIGLRDRVSVDLPDGPGGQACPDAARCFTVVPGAVPAVTGGAM